MQRIGILVMGLAALGGMGIAGAIAASPSPAEPLSHAHAHNDYYHKRPLFDALAHGFCSVEADVFLVEGQLQVAHSRDELRADRTLESLYLQPLRERARRYGGRIYPGGPTFSLLIDIKSEGPATYRAIDRVLRQYAEILTCVRGDQVQEKAVTVIISGNRPEALIAEQPVRYAAIDGRLSDLASDRPAHLLPWISDRWTSHFRWQGEGPMPAAEQAQLRQIVQQAHQQGRRVRFWATPDRPAVWQVLYKTNVDLINTDDLPGLAQFLRSQR